MIALIGLGNPGREYSDTKHNFGFWVLDYFAKENYLTFKMGKGQYVVAKKRNFICIKPTTFMNNSGIALLELKQFFKIKLENILIIYDDIDLQLGTIKFKSNGGAGGHKGIESIIYQLQSENFQRLRVGIATSEIMRPSEKYVLSPFHDRNKEEEG